VIALAEKAKQGKLQPHEFQVRSALNMSMMNGFVEEYPTEYNDSVL